MAMVNPLTAALGLGNILLYSGVYTPMKRRSPWNTWVGAVVGAVPPVMGWVGMTGGVDLGALVLGVALFSWQMPHFFSLAYRLRRDYARAGYQMLSVVNPEATATVSLRHCAILCALPAASVAIGMTDPLFLVDSAVLNAVFTYKAYQFQSDMGSATAQSLFRASLAYLPILFLLLLLHKNDHQKLEEKSE